MIHHDLKHTRQNWIFEEIHQELSPVTYNQPRQLDLKQISWLYFARTMKVFPKISYVDQTRIQTSKKLVKTSEKIVEKQIAVNAQSIK